MPSLEANMFTRLPLASTFSRTFAIFFANKNVFLSISAIACVPFFIMVRAMSSILKSVQTSVFEQLLDGTFVEVSDQNIVMFATIAEPLVENLLYVLVGIFAQCAMALAVAQIYISKSPSVRKCLKVVVSKRCTVFRAGGFICLSMCLFSAIACGGCALFFLSDVGFVKCIGFASVVAVLMVAAYVVAAMILLPSVIMVESKGIKRCWELASGNRIFIYCTLLCMALLQGFVQGCLGQQNHEWLDAALSASVYCFFLPLLTIISTVVYLSIRVERDDLNCEVLGEDLGGCRNKTIAYTVLDGDDGKASQPLIQSV